MTPILSETDGRREEVASTLDCVYAIGEINYKGLKRYPEYFSDHDGKGRLHENICGTLPRKVKIFAETSHAG